MSPRARQAADIVASHPGISRATLATIMRCAPSTAAQHLADAKAAGLVAADSIGRYARWWPVAQPKLTQPGGQRVASVWQLGAAA
jgi:hypothetical protein